MKPKVCVLRAAGTNCDAETAHAFRLVGAEALEQHDAALRMARVIDEAVAGERGEEPANPGQAGDVVVHLEEDAVDAR